MNTQFPSRYEALAKLSIAHSRDFYRRKTQAARFGYELVKKFMAYLGSPLEEVTHVSVASDSLDVRADAGSGRQFLHSVPEVTYHDDGFWYFGVSIQLRLDEEPRYWGTQYLRFGVRPNGDSFTVRLDKDTSLDVDLKETQLDTFFDSIFGELIADYEASLREPSPRRRIGFAAVTIPHSSEPNENTV